MDTLRHDSNGWTIRRDGEPVKGLDGRVLRYDTRAGALSALRLLDRPKRKRKPRAKK